MSTFFLNETDAVRGLFVFSFFWFAYGTALVCNHYLQPKVFAFLVWCAFTLLAAYILNFALGA